MDLDIAAGLGATEKPAAQQFRLYIPDRGQDGPFDPEPWIEKAEALLAKIGGGYTTMRVSGGCQTKGGLERENTAIIYTFIRPQAFRRQLPNLRTLLHLFGRETNQWEVVAQLDGGGMSRFYRIKEYQ